MAEYVYDGMNILHVPGKIDPKGDPALTTPGAIFAPGVPTELDDRDAENPFVKELITQKKLRPAQEDDKARAAEVEAERVRENNEAAKKQASQTGQAGRR